jgi:hypothetical protein
MARLAVLIILMACLLGACAGERAETAAACHTCVCAHTQAVTPANRRHLLASRCDCRPVCTRSLPYLHLTLRVWATTLPPLFGLPCALTDPHACHTLLLACYTLLCLSRPLACLQWLRPSSQSTVVCGAAQDRTSQPSLTSTSQPLVSPPPFPPPSPSVALSGVAAVQAAVRNQLALSNTQRSSRTEQGCTYSQPPSVQC